MTYIQKDFAAAHCDSTPLDELSKNSSRRHSDYPDATVAAARAVAASRFANLDVALDLANRAYWCFMRPAGRPSFTMELMRDIGEMQASVQGMFAGGGQPFDYLVFASRVPGIYNLGGDLGLFAERIRAGDRDTLRTYAHVAVAAIHRNHTAFDVPLITMALVQGDALGGGFECALSLDMIVAERGAKFGLPEILFNLFPGMGAYSFLSRRLDARQAEAMITSGRIYTAAELHEMGVVDILAEDGEGQETVCQFIARNARKLNAHRALHQARRRVRAVPLAELRDVVDIWVDAAMRLEEADLRKMTRLCAAQDRRLAARPAMMAAQ